MKNQRRKLRQNRRAKKLSQFVIAKKPEPMGTMDGPQTPSPCVSAGANNGGSTQLLNDFAPSICQRVPQRPLRFSARSVPCGWSALPFVRKGDTERSFGTARAVWRLLGTFYRKNTTHRRNKMLTVRLYNKNLSLDLKELVNTFLLTASWNNVIKSSSDRYNGRVTNLPAFHHEKRISTSFVFLIKRRSMRPSELSRNFITAGSRTSLAYLVSLTHPSFKNKKTSIILFHYTMIERYTTRTQNRPRPENLWVPPVSWKYGRHSNRIGKSLFFNGFRLLLTC